MGESMQVERSTIYLVTLITALTCAAHLFAVSSSAQTSSQDINPDLRPDTKRALAVQQSSLSAVSRKNRYEPARQERSPAPRPRPLNSGSARQLSRVNRDP